MFFILLLLFSLSYSTAFSQDKMTLLPVDSILLENSTREDIYTLQYKNNQFFVPKGSCLIIYSDAGKIVNTVTFKELKRFFTLIPKRKERFIFDQTFNIYRGRYIDLGCSYLTFSNDSGYATYKAKIIPDKKFHNFRYEGYKIFVQENGFMMPPMVLRHHSFIVSYLFSTDRTFPNTETAENKFFEYYPQLDTLNYLPIYPDFAFYECYNLFIDAINRVGFFRNNKYKSYFIHDDKAKRLRFSRNIYVNDSFAANYLKLASKGLYMPEPFQKFIAHDSVRNHLFFSRPQNEKITVINTATGKPFRYFGTKGTHLKAQDSLMLLNLKEWSSLIAGRNENEITTLKDWYYLEKSNRSVLYLNLNYDAKSNKTYRIYRASLPYTQEEYRKIFWNSSKNVDISNASNFPTYLQIYDHMQGDQLIFDAQVPAPFRILEVKGDTLWAIAGISDNKLKIIKYQLVAKK